ncbi:MAG: hypothetical protein M3N39_02985 [Pseudomonadota bacterium]|nr:hypothetical protein [Pseudomonadota bacterium]
MPVPSWRSAYTEANVLLGHRLISLCDAAVANPMRPNRMPNWKNIASALRQGKPKTQAPAPQSGSAEVLLCQSALRKDGRSFTHLYEIVRRQAGSETTSFQQYYTEAEGQALKLPQDLRTVPQNASEVVRTCKVIGPRGELTDA